MIDGEIDVDFIKLDGPLTTAEGTQLAGEMPVGPVDGLRAAQARPSDACCQPAAPIASKPAAQAWCCSRPSKARCRWRSGQRSASSNHASSFVPDNKITTRGILTWPCSKLLRHRLLRRRRGASQRTAHRDRLSHLQARRLRIQPRRVFRHASSGRRKARPARTRCRPTTSCAR